MNTPENAMLKARQEILAAFEERQLDGGVLRQFIAHAQNETPVMIESHRADASCPEIDLDSRHWTTDYYSRQLLCASFNFSRTRLDHLIDVREYFRQQCYRGFTPQPLISPMADMSTTSQAQQSGNTAASYQPSANLRKFVERGEMDTIRSALRFELNDNRLSREHMVEALNWTKAHAAGVCEPYAERDFAGPLDPNRDNWTVAYYDRQTVYLKTNFAAERFRHLVDVRMHLRERGAEGFVPTDKAIGDTARTAARKAAANAAESAQPSRGAQATPTPRSDNSSPLIRIALLVGGALAAAVILLTLMK